MRMPLHIKSYLLVLPLFVHSLLFCGTSGIIEGIVKDKATNSVLVGVTVRLVGTMQGAATDVDGKFHINSVPAGTYNIEVSLVGYRNVLLKNIRVVADLRTRVEFLMEETTLELSTVEIVSTPPPILKDVTGTLHTVSSKEIELLPVSTFTDVVALQPGVTSDLHMRGGKTTEVLYLVDGLPIQDLINGGAGSDLPRSSIVSLNVQTGGFEAEYGNALSGIVNIVTNGGSNTPNFSVRAEKDDVFGGEEVDHTTEAEVSGGGPFIRDKLFYFGSATFTRSDTRFWQDLSRFFPSPIVPQFTGFAKINYLYSPELKLSAQLLASTKSYHDYEYSWRFNLNGLPQRSQNAYRGALIATHTISPSFFYTVSLSQYHQQSHIGQTQESFPDTSLYQYDFFLQYVLSGSRIQWADNKQTINTMKGDATLELSQHHLLKWGGELNLYSIYSNLVRFEPRKNIWGKPFLDKPLLNYSSDYSYHPYSGSAYLQDKIELSKEGMLFNIGVRMDFLNPRAQRPEAEWVPISEDEYQTNITKYVSASAKYLFSPRVGFSAPFAERGFVFINYGQYVQFPLFDYLYSGLNNVSLQKGVGVLVGNPDLQPEKTKAWEISVKYAFKNDLVFSTTYFDKTTYNQIDVKTFVPSIARIAGDYGFAEFVNNPYARATGVEFLLSRETHDFLTGSISYTLMSAEGLSQDARQGLDYYQWGFEPPPKLFPLSWDQRHTIKVIANFRLPWETELSALWTYNTGRPYTFYPTYDGFTPLDSTMKFVPNNARLSDVNDLDIKAAKHFQYSQDLRITLFVDVRNLFNHRNARWSDSSGRIGGELGDLSAWDPYRRTRLGLRVEF